MNISKIRETAPGRPALGGEAAGRAPVGGGQGRAHSAKVAPAKSARVTVPSEPADQGVQSAVTERHSQKLEEFKEKQVVQANEQISGGAQRIEVDRDERSGRFVMKVVDSATGQLLRQFPPESLLKVNERLEELSGMLLALEV